MMSTYDELRKKFDTKVKELQAKCPHSDISDWMTEYWAIGHPTGFKVKICNICRKEVDRMPPKEENKIWKNMPHMPSDEILKEMMNRDKKEV